MAKKLFITATGTDIGKTYISALIVKKMRECGYNCGYYKPVMSGVVELGGHLVDSDANQKLLHRGILSTNIYAIPMLVFWCWLVDKSCDF